MAGLAAQIYGRPAEAMTMFAVTGTNGKTTTTFLLEAALRAAGVHTGLIGTIGFRLDRTPAGGGPDHRDHPGGDRAAGACSASCASRAPRRC